MDKNEAIKYLIKNNNCIKENKKNELLVHFIQMVSQNKFLIKRDNILQNLEMYLRNKIEEMEKYLKKEDYEDNREYLISKIFIYKEIEEKIKEFRGDKQC